MIFTDNESELRASHIIVIYHSDNVQYIELAEVKKDNVGRFEPLTKSNAKRLYESLNVENIKLTKFGFYSFVDRRILKANMDYGSYDLIWLCPSHINTYHHKNIKEKKEIKYPHLIFRLRDEQLNIYCIKTLNIKEDTMLFRPPLFNISNSGSLCWGNVKVKNYIKKDLAKTIPLIEHAFFKSKFSNENTSEQALAWFNAIKNDKPLPKVKLDKIKKLKHALYP